VPDGVGDAVIRTGASVDWASFEACSWDGWSLDAAADGAVVDGAVVDGAVVDDSAVAAADGDASVREERVEVTLSVGGGAIDTVGDGAQPTTTPAHIRAPITIEVRPTLSG
jgi:hypothetical protein